MVVIRKNQLVAMQECRVAKFKLELADHLRSHFPVDYQMIGDDQVYVAIQLAIDRAMRHGLTSKGDVCCYANMMFALGAFFDEDPQLAWSGQLLAEQRNREATSLSKNRTNALYERALDYLLDVSGNNGEYYRKALRSIRRTPLDTFLALDTNSAWPILGDIYPQKAEYLGKHGVKILFECGTNKSVEVGMRTPEMAGVFCVFMFMLGSGFIDDPVYPWIRSILANGSAENDLIKRLHQAALERIDLSRSLR